ncbi:hypothetical protein [Brasilonema sp. UFV-L1]|uniref:hypothetical protein n=1 Tax=Brasilonema sp. UFV-L1 TaxID=2234130 RepID=UPI00145C73B9|nr:hypothetical protein [Brasilonema sp. UFV-L1]NMG11858.1 hypothetical protein [Brasilonema sp. UFV-L1]
MDSKIYVNYKKLEYVVTEATEEIYTLAPVSRETDQSFTIPTAKAKHIDYKSKSVKHVRKFARKLYTNDAIASDYVERLALTTGGYREAYCYLFTQIA